jgi:hypothetical protein
MYSDNRQLKKFLKVDNKNKNQNVLRIYEILCKLSNPPHCP